MMNAANQEPGVYKVAEGGFGYLRNSGAFCGPISREAARKMAVEEGNKTTTKGVFIPTIEPEEVEISVEVPIVEETPENAIEVKMPEPYSTPKRGYQRRDFESYQDGSPMVSIDINDKKANNRFYMACYMHRRNHPDSTFNFRFEDSDGYRTYFCVRTSKVDT